MKLFSKNLSTMFFYKYSREEPIFMFDVFRHTFTFVYVRNPRTEEGVSIVLVLFKVRFHFSIERSKPYEIKSAITKRLRENWYGDEKRDS